MPQVKVSFLKIEPFYSDGQSLVDDKEEAMMPPGRIQYYLDGAKRRSINFSVETETIDVPEDEVENYEFWGYEIIRPPT
jgi:hypothetical protein